MIKPLHHFIFNIHNLYITFLVFREAVIERCFFKGFDKFFEIITREEEDLHAIYMIIYLEHLLMTASVMIHFISCVNQFPASASHNLMFSVLLGLHKL